MTEYNEPNRFCGECGAYAAFGEPETTPEENEAILEGCKQCQGWQYMGIQLLNKDNVGQCWNCINQIDKELINTTSGEKLYIPYCLVKMSYVCGLKEEDMCHSFKLR